MKKFRRLITLALAICMLSATVILPVSAETGSELGAVDAEVQQALGKLVAFGIIDRADAHQFTDIVTRAEFADYLLKMMGQSEGIMPDGLFYDVDRDYWASGSIATAVQLGWLGGFSDGKFYPESPVLPMQIVKAFVDALGYELPASIKGGYPNGYATVAREIKLLGSLNVYTETEVEFGLMLKLMAQALDVKVLDIKVYGGVKYDYSNTSGDTLLSKLYDVQKLRGKVTENEYTGLYNSSAVRKNTVKIGADTYKVGYTDIADKLGYIVDYYARIDEASDEGTIIYYSLRDSNQVTVVNGEDITGGSAYSFSYRNSSGRTITADIPAGVAFIYNGVAKPSYASADLLITNGRVTLIDADDDGVIDCVKVFDVHSTVRVNYVSTDVDGCYVFDKNNAEVYASLPVVNGRHDFEIYRNDIQIGVAEVNENEILSIGYSDGGGHAIVMVSDKNVTGAVGYVSSNGYVEIDGEEFKVSDYYIALSQTVGLNIKEIKTGMSGMFFFNFLGEICAFDVNASIELQYAYILDAMVKQGLEATAQLKVITLDKGVETLNLAKYVSLDDLRVTPDRVITALYNYNVNYPSTFASQARPYMQLVKYGVDGDGFINRIYQAKPESANPELIYSGTIFNQDEYAHYKNTWANKYYRTSSTQIFYIFADDDLCAVSNEYTLADNRRARDYFYFYDADEKGTVQAVVTYPESGTNNNSVDKSKMISVVTGRGQGIDSEGMTADSIRCYTAGKRDSILYNEDTLKASTDKQEIFKNAKPGDILIYSTNSKGQLESIIKVFSSDPEWIDQYGICANDDNRLIPAVTGVQFHSPQGFLFGNAGEERVYYATIHQARKLVAAKVGKVFSDCFQFIITPGDIRVQRANPAMLVYRIILKADGDVDVIPNLSYSALKPGDTVFYRCEADDVKELVIIEDNRPPTP